MADSRFSSVQRPVSVAPSGGADTGQSVAPTLVERLRAHWECAIDGVECLPCQAADEIERLQRTVDGLHAEVLRLNAHTTGMVD